MRTVLLSAVWISVTALFLQPIANYSISHTEINRHWFTAAVLLIGTLSLIGYLTAFIWISKRERNS